MKNRICVGIWILLLLCMVPSSLWAWCWIRDSSTTDANCSGGLVQQDCCDGNLRIWSSGSMTYQISDSTLASLDSYIVAGMNRWTNVAMADFTFTRGADTAVWEFGNDNINLVNIDSSFCAHTDMCGMGILGFSGTFSTGSGASYRAVESDIILNGEEFTWGDGTGGTEYTEAVIAHEGGHSAGLSHAGSECNSAGSSGCGPEFEEATMFWNYSMGQPTDKASLELDEIAALVYGYPRSSFRVRVLNTPGDPIIGAEVLLLDSAAPVNGSSIDEGGSIYGDVTDATVLFGDDAVSSTYVDSSPFNDTDGSGYTNYINPVHADFSVQAIAGGANNTSVVSSLVAGTSELDIILSTTSDDFAGPTVAVTSHTSSQAVGTATITLAGTATDSERGGSGISQVTVNGDTAADGTATGSNTANWSRDVTLSIGANTITIVAYDDSSETNTTTRTISITYDTTPPEVDTVTPADGSTDVAVNANFGVSFSEALNPSSVNTSTFLVDNGVTGTVTYSAGSNRATFVPSAPLAHGTTYTATLTTGIQDAVGLPMAANFTWSISTIDPTGGSGDGGGSGCFIGTATAR